MINNDKPDLTLVHHAERTLSSFCKWQHGINNIDGNRPGVARHDNAVLLTGLVVLLNSEINSLRRPHPKLMIFPHFFFSKLRIPIKDQL